MSRSKTLAELRGRVGEESSVDKGGKKQWENGEERGKGMRKRDGDKIDGVVLREHDYGKRYRCRGEGKDQDRRGDREEGRGRWGEWELEFEIDTELMTVRLEMRK